MRKIFIFLLAVFYLLASTGADLQGHFCMGRFLNITMLAGSDNACAHCGMPASVTHEKGCCHTEHRFVRMTNPQTIPASLAYNHFLPAAVVPAASSFQYNTLPNGNRQLFSDVHAPPGTTRVPRYTLHCSFLI